MRTILHWLTAMVLLLAVTACGDSGGSATQSDALPSVSLAADKTQAVADGRDTVTLTATVRDQNGTPKRYQAVSFNVPPGTNPYIYTGSTDAYGQAVIRLSCPPDGQSANRVFDVTAASGGVTSSAATIIFAAPPQVAPALVTLTADKTTLLADGSDRVTFTITASDANGAPLAGQTYHLDLPSGPYSVATRIVTNAAGQATAALMRYSNALWPPLTSPTVVSITATINGTTSNAVVITVNPP